MIKTVSMESELLHHFFNEPFISDLLHDHNDRALPLESDLFHEFCDESFNSGI